MAPRARAALIALVLVFGVIDGLPLPAPERAEALAPGLGRYAAGAAAVQSVLAAPFRPLRDLFAFSERWSLFAGASRLRFRLEIAGRRRDQRGFQLLYRAGDPAHRAFAELVEYRRVRGAYNPRTQEPPPGYDAFASFIARRACGKGPELGEVRVRMERIVLQDRGGYERTGEFVHERRRRCAEVMP